MKFKLVTELCTEPHTKFTEEYNKQGVHNKNEATLWSNQLIYDYNNLVDHNSQRKFVEVIVDEEPVNHEWVIEDEVFINKKRNKPYRKAHCKNCEVTGRLYDGAEEVERDDKFLTSKYKYCTK